MLATWGLGQTFLAMLFFFFFVMWIMLVFRLLVDVITSDMSGGKKVLWILFGFFFPLIGALAYIIVNGENMARRELGRAQAQQAQVDQYIRDAAGTSPSPAAELERLAALKAQGVIDDAEFARLKAKVVG